MISIEDSSLCHGCRACGQICPQGCISFSPDREGALYPKVDVMRCTDCGACERVCSVLHPWNARIPLAVIAAQSKDSALLRESSSGALFTLLARRVLDRGGVVYGAAFDEEWRVVHRAACSEAELAPLRQSKYVQSDVGNVFSEVRQLLRADREVLFCGTPCQVAGLLHYLGKPHARLLTVDFICHGVPTPGAWNYFMDELLNQSGFLRNEISQLSFRNKRQGWRAYHFRCQARRGNAELLLQDEPFRYHPFLRGFLYDLYLRPSCYACAVRELRSGSDLTLGDCWGAETLAPALDAQTGISVLFMNTEKGKIYAAEMDCEQKLLQYQEVLRYNPSLQCSPGRNKKKEVFWQAMEQGRSFSATVARLTGLSFKHRIAGWWNAQKIKRGNLLKIEK